MRLIEVNPNHLIPVRRILELRSALRCEHGETILTVIQFPKGIVEISSSRVLEDLRAEIMRESAPAQSTLAEIEIDGTVYVLEHVQAIGRRAPSSTIFYLGGGGQPMHATSPDEHAAIVAQWRAARAACGGARR